MEYIKESSAKLPVPFNLLPSIDAIKSVYKMIKNYFKKNTSPENNLSYNMENIVKTRVIKKLFNKYIIHT